jgi:hypothetical protein
MALVATFTANFQQFDAAVKNAQKNVESFEFNVKGTQRALQQMVSSFDGSRVIRDATLMAAAVEKIGGAAKLTESEQKRLNATVTEALAKYQALGQQAPAELQKIADSLKKVEQESEKAAKATGSIGDGSKKAGDSMLSMGGIAKGVGGVLAATFTVGAVASFAKEIIALGGEIEDLSARTGISVEAVQELKYAAEQTGTSIDVVSGAINKMSDGLVAGDKGTVKAVRDLGLSLKDLRNSSPEAAFTAITTALQGIPDEMQQVNLGRELLGRGFDQLLPAVKEGFSGLRQSARDTGQVLSEENVKALAAFGDKWDSTMSQIKASSATAALEIGRGFGDMFSQLQSGLDGLVPDRLLDLLDNPTFQSFLRQAGRLTIQAVPGGQLVNTLSDIQERGRQAQGQGRLEKLRDEILGKRANSVGSGGGGTDDDLVKHLAEVRQKVAELTTATKAQIVAGNDLKRNEDEISKATGVSVEVIKLYNEQLKKHEEQRKKLAGLSMVEDFKETITKAKILAKEIDSGRISIANLGTKQQEVNKQLRDAEQAMKALGATGDPLYQRIVSLANATTDWGGSFGKVKSGIDDVINAAGKIDQKQFELLNDLQFGDLGSELSKVKLGLPSGIGANVKNADEAFRPKRRTGRDNIDQMLGFAASGNGSVSQFANTLRDARQAQQQFGKYGIGSQMFTGSVGNRVAAGAAVGVGVIQGAQDVWGATDKAGAGERALGGALAGAKAGAMFGPYGMAIGAAAGLVIGLVRGKPEWAKAADEVGRDFGVKISAALGKEIAKTAKELFKGDRSTAAQFHLGDIIKEAGGVNDLNFDKMTEKLRDTFSFLERGQFSKEQARKVIEDNFQSFADHVLNSTHLASKGFQELFALNKRFGLESAQMREFVDGQTKTLGSSIANLVGPLAEKYHGLAASIAEARKEVDDLAKAGGEGSSEHAKAVEDLNILLQMQKDAAAGATEEFERLGVIALGAFNAAINAGADWVTAVQNMAPALDTLIGLQKDLGIESQNAGLAELVHFRDLVTQNETLILSAQALGDTMKALSTIGGLNVETLAAMEAQGISTFNKLTAAGFSEQQALRQMKTFLLNVIEAHEQLGIPIDENTAKLIDQADSYGLLRDDGKAMFDLLKGGFETLTKGINRLIETMGGVPLVVDDIADALNGLPSEIDIGVNVNYNDPGFQPNGGDYSQAWNGPSYANGTNGFENFGSGTLAMLHGEEAIIPRSRMNSAGGGASVIHVHLETDGREFAHAVVPYMPEVLDYYGATR